MGLAPWATTLRNYQNSKVSWILWFINKNCYYDKRKQNKNQRNGFLGMLLLTLHASLLGNMLAGKGFMRAGEGITSPKGWGKTRAGQGF